MFDCYQVYQGSLGHTGGQPRTDDLCAALRQPKNINMSRTVPGSCITDVPLRTRWPESRAGYHSKGAGYHSRGAGYHSRGAGYQGRGAGYQGSAVGCQGSAVGCHGSTVGCHGSTVGCHGSTVGCHGRCPSNGSKCLIVPGGWAVTFCKKCLVLKSV